MSAKPQARRARWLRPAKTTYAPSVLVSVVCEPWHDAKEVMKGVYERTLRHVHVAHSRRRSGGWSEMEYKRFTDPEDFWTWLETALPRGRRIHVMTPNVYESAVLLGFMKRLDVNGCEHETAATFAEFKRRRFKAVPGTPERPGVYPEVKPEPRDERYFVRAIIEGATASILRYRCNWRSYLWCSNSQYVTATEEQVAQAIDYTWVQSPAIDGSLPNRLRTPLERALLWCRFYMRLCRWWVRNDGGPWGATVASCSGSFLRRRIKPETILQHANPHAGALEERAIVGGRRSVWYVGNIGTEADWKQPGFSPPSRSPHGTLPGPMIHHDIRSMYPWLLATREYPVQHLTVRRAPSIAALKNTVKAFGVIALVHLWTQKPEYPQKTSAGIRWPIGSFATCLAGPELALALDEGIVQSCEYASVYKMGRPFEETCLELLELRERYRADGEAAMELWTKALSNAMSGKMAQREHQWVPRPDVFPQHRWGNWKKLNAKTKQFHVYRSIAGMVDERVPADDRIRPMGAAYAYLTSYGRVLMRHLRERCPPRTVIAQDTDGIWTLSSALEALYGNGDRNGSRSGDLRVTTSSPAGRFFGPQHYWWGRSWVLSGQSVPIVQAGSDKAEVRTVSTGVFTATECPRAVVYEKRIIRDIGRIQSCGQVGEDGWVIPHHTDQRHTADEFMKIGAADWYN